MINTILIALKAQALQIEADLKQIENAYKDKKMPMEDYIVTISSLMGTQYAYIQIIKFIEEEIEKGE